MNRLFFDIETLPCEETKKDDFVGILIRKSKSKEITKEEAFINTGLDGTFGRICCIGYMKDGSVPSKGVLCGNEKDMLTGFWNLSKDVQLFVGHNIFEFDFPFIYKRSIILGVKPRFDLNFAKYRSSPIYDTMCEWEKWSNNRQSLDTLAKVLGFPTSKDKMAGNQVWTYYQEGKLKEICEYCLKDVELTRKIYYKMIFEKATNQSHPPQDNRE